MLIRCKYLLAERKVEEFEQKEEKEKNKETLKTRRGGGQMLRGPIMMFRLKFLIAIQKFVISETILICFR